MQMRWGLSKRSDKQCVRIVSGLLSCSGTRINAELMVFKNEIACKILLRILWANQRFASASSILRLHMIKCVCSTREKLTTATSHGRRRNYKSAANEVCNGSALRHEVSLFAVVHPMAIIRCWFVCCICNAAAAHFNLAVCQSNRKGGVNSFSYKKQDNVIT